MSEPRRKFRREGEDRRRQDLIEATLDCVSDKGIKGATLRAIALRAGVTAGLIRHYFPGKDELMQAAYRATVSLMTEQALAALADAPQDPVARLAVFVRANLAPPVVDPRVFTLWAGFIGLVHTDAAMAAVHREGYLDFRGEAEALLASAFAAHGKSLAGGELRRFAIALNAIIDGLWLEGCLAADLFASGELAETGLDAVEALTGLPLRNCEGGTE